jgi:hypothetical protein
MMIGTLSMSVYTCISIVRLNTDVNAWHLRDLSKEDRIAREAYIEALSVCLKNDIHDPNCKPQAGSPSWELTYYH